jgi:CheY-like chemotaxis protein
MFYQRGDAAHTNAGGLGLGLTLARSLAEMHGGTLVAESAGLGCGSTFTLRLPVAGAETCPVRAEIDVAGSGGHRVLVVDDNVDAAATLGMLIQELGDNEVVTADCGEAALARVAQFHPDIVFLDLKMPGMDGCEVARRLREQPGGRSALLVALTGYGQAADKRRTAAAGFDRHLTKPADLGALRAVLAQSPTGRACTAASEGASGQ